MQKISVVDGFAVLAGSLLIFVISICVSPRAHVRLFFWQFAMELTGDMKIFVDMENLAEFNTKFNQELVPRLRQLVKMQRSRRSTAGAT